MPAMAARADAAEERAKGAPQPTIDTATKPIKWKSIITKELESVGGSLSVKKLRKATVAEVLAHPSYSGRNARDVKREFDEVLPTFHKYTVTDGTVSLAAKPVEPANLCPPCT